MFTKFLVVFLASLFLVGCFGGTFYGGLMTECDYVVINGTKYNGTSRLVHKDGWTFASGKVQNGSKEGWWTYYRKDGSIYTKQFFKEGEREGHFEHYYENGQIACKGMSKFIEPSANLEYFDPNGNPIARKKFIEKYDKLIGKWIDELWKEKYE